MERNIRRIGVVNFITLVAAGVLSLALGRYANSLAAQVAAVFFKLGSLTAFFSLFHMGLEEKERLEKLEFDELTREKSAASLFNAQEAEAFPARRAREQFERWVAPAFALLLVIGIGLNLYFLNNWLKTVPVVAPNQPMVAVALFAVAALMLFLLGKYSANLARLENQRLVRPAASYLVLGAYLLSIAALGLGLVWGGQPRMDYWIAKGFLVVIALVGIEGVITLILEIYRPRVRGKQVRVVYESRLIGLIGQPEGIVSSAARALDYQFGFKVSETWFYRFLERALAWIILAQVAVALLSTMVVFINPGEQGLIERWGRPRAEQILNPGMHLKMPWPMEKVYRFQTDKIQTFNVGFVAADDGKEHNEPVLWTVSHYKEEFNLLVASKEQGLATGRTNSPGGVPVDLLTVSIPVQFQIHDVKAWAYKHLNAGDLLEKIATREVIRYLVGVDIFDIMSTGRAKASEELRSLIQKRADELSLGMRIVFVGLQDIHPPVKAAQAFEKVVATLQENQAALRKAEGYAARTLAISQAEAAQRLRDAEAYKHRKIASAGGQAAQFTNRIAAFNASPRVFSERAYLQSLSRGMTNARKYVFIATNTTDVINFDMKEQMRTDLLEIAVPKPR